MMLRRALILAILAACDSETGLDNKNQIPDPPLDECEWESPPAEPVEVSRACAEQQPPEGRFIPIIEWAGGRNKNCTSQPVVGDLDGDGMPEIVVNETSGIFTQVGRLTAYRGDGTDPLWTVPSDAGYGASPAIADLDNDRHPEVLVVRAVDEGVLGFGGTYAVVAYNSDGTERWVSDQFGNNDMDYATAIAVADMDDDGEPEIVAGRVILRADGTTRGVGEHGRGSWGILPGLNLSEGGVPAVIDVDLDGIMEVVVGDAMYSPDGETLWFDPDQDDGMVAIGNFDDDPEAERVVASYNTVRVVDDDGTIAWGPRKLNDETNIVSPPAIADVDNDGFPEFIVAGGNSLVVFNHDGTRLWETPATDLSGATGASVFDFEGDGTLEVVYIDEIQMAAFDGLTGAIKFWTDEHRSATMLDYPTIADVDADGHAEVVVCHQTYGYAFSVYGDEDNSWMPTRGLWNQHAYWIDNISDDLSIPDSPAPSFTTHNTWHAASFGDADPVLTDGPVDVGADLLGACDTICSESGTTFVYGRLVNRGPNTVPGGISMALYARINGVIQLVDTQITLDPVEPGNTGPDVVFEVPNDIAANGDLFRLAADDDGTQSGAMRECLESNNADLQVGALCSL
jgi:hypothetical protein